MRRRMLMGDHQLCPGTRHKDVKRWMIGVVALISFGLTMPLGITRPLISPADAVSASEIRGVWITNIDSEVMFDADALERSLDELAGFHFNTLYPTVWNWGYTLYPSAIAEQTFGLRVDPRPDGLRDRDVLAEFVQEGHERGFSVIPWFEFGFMTDAGAELARAHPDWITQRRDGSVIWQDGIYQRMWLNPFRPEVQQFILGLVEEIAGQYDIDGIQFDDHFGLPFDFGYDAYTTQLYRQEHGGQAPPSDPRDPTWVSWRANKITAFMTQVFHAIKAQRHDAIVALSPNGYPFSYNYFLQDWRTWERRGLVEELMVQVYRDDAQQFASELDRPEVQDARRHIPTGVGILTGLKDRPVSIRQVGEQVQMARQKQFAGVSFFFYETLWNLTTEQPSDRQRIFQQLFTSPSDRPRV